MIWNIHLGSQIPVNGSGFFSNLGPGSKGQKGTGSGIRNPNTDPDPKNCIFFRNNFKKEYSGVTTQSPPSYPPPPTL
jgi:hypothetical protein